MISDDTIMMLFGVWVHWVLPVLLIVMVFCFVMAVATGQVGHKRPKDKPDGRSGVSLPRSEHSWSRRR